MSSTALRPLLRLPTTPSFHHHPPLLLLHSRGAKLLRRPKRPHLLDQIVILSDGSSYKQLTTSPRGILRTTKDTRNHPIWNASDALLAGLEEDDAGMLKAFRLRYGRGFDVENEGADAGDNLMDLFSLAERVDEAEAVAAAPVPQEKAKKAKKGKKGKE